MEGNKVMFALLLLVALCSIVAIIISAISLSRPSSVPTITLNGIGGAQGAPVVVNGGGSGNSKTSSRVYTIAAQSFAGPHSYIDEKGELQGFLKELATEVCEYARIDCRIVMAPFTYCWKSVPGGLSEGGQGLLAGWIDACVGWQTTPLRVRIFDFSSPFLRPLVGYFFVKHGVKFNPLDLTGKKIGFFSGIILDPPCIARQPNIVGNTIPVINQVYFANPELAGKALQDGNVTAVFALAEYFMHYTRDHGPVIDRINSTDIICPLQGPGLMTRKDNDLIPKWDRGFKKMKEGGRFHQLCEEAHAKHGHKGEFKGCID